MTEYEIKKVAVVFIIKKNDEFLFLKREHTNAGDGYYMFPGGHVNKGEPVLQAAVRELKEELNIQVTPDDFIFRLVESGKTHINFFFEITHYEGVIQNNEPNKHSEAVFLPLNHQDIYPDCLSEIRAIERGQYFLSKD